MIYYEVAIGVMLFAAFLHYYFTKRKNEFNVQLLASHIGSNEEIKKTLAMGLYLRFNDKHRNSVEREIGPFSSAFIQQKDKEFETFVSNIFQSARGGTTWVTPPSGDYGVDFEHRTNEGLYLGQVKCHKNDLPFDPIAIVHSNMVKEGAIGGYVVNTASFTPSATKYAKSLNIELIDGVKLVELWLESQQEEEKEITEITPEFT